MLRVILGAVVGFVVWSILWVGTDVVFSALSPNWYGSHQTEFDLAVSNKAPFSVNSTILVLGLIRSFIFSVISGYITAFIAKENTLSPVIVGVLLLLFGIFIQSIYWNYVPLWYHIPFLLLLIPFAILGGKLRKAAY